MKDNDLLVTELYHDPSNDAVTALSVYLTPKTSQYTVSLVHMRLGPDRVLGCAACSWRHLTGFIRQEKCSAH